MRRVVLAEGGGETIVEMRFEAFNGPDKRDMGRVRGG